MAKVNAQVSVEYLILTLFVLLIVIIPAVFFVQYYANKSISESVQTQITNDLGAGLTTVAQQMYYLGVYSKRTVTYEIPINVERMYLIELDDGSDLFYYFIIITDDGNGIKRHIYQSTVPLISDESHVNVDRSDHSADISECATAGCSFYTFKGSTILPGDKKFKIETVYDGNEVKGSIIPLDA